MDADASAAQPDQPPAGRRLIEHPILYLALLALYAASFSEGLIPPEGDAWPAPRPAPPGRSLEDLLRHPREAPFGLAAAIVVPLLLGTGLLIGYIIVRAHGLRVFPHREFPIPPWPGWHLARAAIVLLVLMRGIAVGIPWLPRLRSLGLIGHAMPTGVILALASNLSMLLLCLFVAALVGTRGGSPLRLLGLRGARPTAHPLAGLAGFLMAYPVILGVGMVMFILGPRVGIPPQPQEVLVHVAALSPRAFALILISIAIVTPITEEIVFRGFLHATLRRSMGPLGAILLSSIVFALLHAYLFGLPALFVIGFLLAWLYERTSSLLPSIVAHAAHNFYTLLLTYFAIHHAL